MKCKAYKCIGTLYTHMESDMNYKCDTCKRIYGPPPELKDYEDYEKLFNDDLVVAVRKLLERLDDGEYDENGNGIEDSDEHNEIKGYFNKFDLWRKNTKEGLQISQYLGQE